MAGFSRVLAAVVLLSVTATALHAHPAPSSAQQLWEDQRSVAASAPQTLSVEGEDVPVAYASGSDGLLASAWIGSTDGKLFLNGTISRDNGATWTPTSRRALDVDALHQPTLRLVSHHGSFVVARVYTTGSHQAGWTTSVEALQLDSTGTWGEPQRLSDLTLASGVQFATHNAGITATWVERGGLLIGRTSLDGGVSWGAPTVISVMRNKALVPQRVVEQDGTLIALWIEADVSEDQPDSLMAARSVDGGTTWGEKSLVMGGVDMSLLPSVVHTNTSVLVAIGVREEGSDVYPTELRVSNDGGVSWQTPGWAAPEDADWEWMFANDDTLLITTTDSGIQRSTDGGLTWTEVAYPFSKSWSTLGDGALFGDSLYLTHWLPNGGYQLRVSHDLGETWKSAVWARTPSTGSSMNPVFVSSGSGVAIVWTTREPGQDYSSVRVASIIETERRGGQDRYETAVLISQEFDSFSKRSGSVVYIATGSNFPDALVASTAAASRQGPLLLTRHAGLDVATLNELRRLNPESVVIVGGASVVSEQVRTQAASVVGAANVTRIGGANRYETARLVVQGAFPRLTTLYVATGRDFPDALAAAAAAASQDAAVMVTDGRSNTIGADLDELLRTLGVQRVVIAGGSSAVSLGIEAELESRLGPSNVTRIGGANRFETSSLLSASGGPYGGTTYLATGSSFADALGGGALAGATGSRLFAVPAQCVPNDVLVQLAGTQRVVLLGGPSTLFRNVRSLEPC